MSTSLQIKVGCVCAYVVAVTVTVVWLLADESLLSNRMIVAAAFG
jgi:hypothetical protein